MASAWVAPLECVHGFDRKGRLVRVARHTAPTGSRVVPAEAKRLEELRILSLSRIADTEGVHRARLITVDGNGIVDIDPAELLLYRTKES